MGADGIGRGVAEAFVGLVAIAFLTGAALVGALVWLIPRVRELIKPWLHSVTV